MKRLVLRLAIPAFAGIYALAWLWTGRAFEDGWRVAMRANRYRVSRHPGSIR